MMITFEESGMTFAFPENRLFRIEKAAIASRATGLKVCECVVRRDDEKVCLIEAKSSSPKPNGEKGQEAFDDFIKQITQKFADTLTIYHAILLRHDGQDIPKELLKANPKTTDYQLTLIINGHQESWLQPISDALKSKLKGVLRVWRIADSNVKVLNDQQAKSRGLIN